MSVSAQVGELRGALRAVVADLDPDSVPLPQVNGLWADFDAIEKLAAGAKLLLARKVEESGQWQRERERSAAHYLARRAGTSVGSAKGALSASQKLAELPKVDEAVREGKLSPPQAEAIADAAHAAPHKQQELINAASRERLAELKDRCAKVKAAAQPDDEARHRAIHAERFCTKRTTPEGAGELWYRSTPEELAQIWAVVQGYATRAFEAARAEGRRESHGAYAADGLLAMAKAAAGGASATENEGAKEDHQPTTKKAVPTKVIVRIDWDALIRGFPLDGEVCEVAGIGPVPVSVVKALIASGDVFLAAVVTKGKDVATVAHLGRRPTAHQDTALQWRDPTCTREGCSRTEGLERDHREDWSKTKVTLLSYLDRLCDFDHDLKTRYGWALVEGRGKRPMVPPGNPDHPGTKDRSPPASEEDAA